MGKVDLFTILLDKQECTYLAGETISGKLIIKIQERLKVNSVKMSLHGYAKVHWSESVGNGKHRKNTNYNSHEQYINYGLVFTPKQTNNAELYLEIGDYSYPFKIQLPSNLPTSFEHAHGRLRYSLNGTIDIPWAFDKHVQKCITIINHVDLNKNVALKQPYSLTQSKTLYCLCCKSDPINATLSIKKGGYVPGEEIMFDAKIENNSSNDIKSVSVRLVQHITLHSTRKSKTWTRSVNETKFQKHIVKKSSSDWDNGSLVIPPVCASSNNTCRIITVTYFFVLNVNPNGLSVSFDLAIPIVIGTIPLNTSGSRTITPKLNFQKSAFISSGNDALESETNGEIFNLDSGFAPLYPYYKDLKES